MSNNQKNCPSPHYNLRKYKRCFCRVISGLEKDPNCRFVTLTSSTESRNPIQQDFRRLIMRLKRRGRLQDYIKVIELTKSGLEHIHMVFRGDYVDKQLLSYLWNEIHQAPNTDIRQLWQNTTSYKRVAGYLAKEMSKQGYRRYSWSWGWVYKGFVAVWRQAKAFYSQARMWSPHELDFGHFLNLWHAHLKNRSPPKPFLLMLEAQAIQLRMAFYGIPMPTFYPRSA